MKQAGPTVLPPPFACYWNVILGNPVRAHGLSTSVINFEGNSVQPCPDMPPLIGASVLYICKLGLQGKKRRLFDQKKKERKEKGKSRLHIQSLRLFGSLIFL